MADAINERPDVPLAVLPLGNENLFARELGFTRDVAALARAVAAGRSRRIDLGCVGGRLFSLMVTAGFDAAVIHRLARWRAGAQGLRRVRHLSYVRPILRTIRHYPYPVVELEADGVTARGAHAMVFNLRAYALRLGLAPDARADDGLMDWLVLERPGLGRLLSYVTDVVLGRHRRRPDVQYGRARCVRIAAESAVPVQADGDALGVTPIEVAVEPQALQVIVAETGDLPGDAGLVRIDPRAQIE